jgi:hypothetical protein
MPEAQRKQSTAISEVRQKSICTDRACYRMKVEALVQIRMKPVEAAAEKPLRVSHVPAWQVKQRNPDVLYEGHYRTVRKAEWPQTRPAVVTDGTDAGKVLHVCRDEKCSVHASVSNYQPTPIVPATIRARHWQDIRILRWRPAGTKSTRQTSPPKCGPNFQRRRRKVKPEALRRGRKHRRKP